MSRASESKAHRSFQYESLRQFFWAASFFSLIVISLIVMQEKFLHCCWCCCIAHVRTALRHSHSAFHQCHFHQFLSSITLHSFTNIATRLLVNVTCSQCSTVSANHIQRAAFINRWTFFGEFFYRFLSCITRKASCRWQTRATLAKRLHSLRKSSGIVSCIASLPIDSLPMVSY